MEYDKVDPSSLDYILQKDFIQDFIPSIGKQQWQTLYNGKGEPAIWCALLDSRAAARTLEHMGWDFNLDDGKPSFSQGSKDGETVVTYHRFGAHGDGIRPLLYRRFFNGAFPIYFEFEEEFRLYHDLAHDPKRGLLLAFDESGREIEAARMEENGVRAQTKYLRQYQAGTGLHLAIYFENHRYSNVPVSDIPETLRRVQHKDATTRWEYFAADWNRDGWATISGVVGKVILPPPPREAAGVWPFDGRDQKRFADFIIGADGEGTLLEHTSNPNQLDNYFSANPGATQYLTPVYFRREVLAKYFAESHRFTVADGRVGCLGLWSCQIDNDRQDVVAVFLGDLGRDLPYEEQLHWRTFNIPYEGKLSETSVRRNFLAQFTNASSPDLAFQFSYQRLAECWQAKQGWTLFLPLREGDAHLLDAIRIPVTNAQAELDEQIGFLTKLLVDSLNEKGITKIIGPLPEGKTGSITRFEVFLTTSGFPSVDMVVKFLRNLQSLRSTGTAHRKGSQYTELVEKLGIEPELRIQTGTRLLTDAVAALTALQAHYCGTAAE